MKNNQPNLNKLTHSLLAASALIVLTTQAHAALYNVDFNGNAFGAPNSTYSGAAVTGAVGDFWNGFTNTSGTGSLSLSSAIPGSPNVTVMVPTMGDQYADNGANDFSSTAFVELMGAHMYLTNTTAAVLVTLGGFEPLTPFSLWIYGVGDPDVGKGGAFSVNGGAIQTNLIANVSTFVDGNNYLNFTGSTSLTGEIVLSGKINTGNEYLLNGFQVEATPAPEPTASLLSAVVGVLGLMTRRRAAKR